MASYKQWQHHDKAEVRDVTATAIPDSASFSSASSSVQHTLSSSARNTTSCCHDGLFTDTMSLTVLLPVPAKLEDSGPASLESLERVLC